MQDSAQFDTIRAYSFNQKESRKSNDVVQKLDEIDNEGQYKTGDTN